MTTYLTPQAKRERIAELGDRLGVSETATYAAKIYAGAATALSMVPTFIPDAPLELRVGTPLALVAPALAVGVYQLGKMAVTNVQLALAARSGGAAHAFVARLSSRTAQIGSTRVTAWPQGRARRVLVEAGVAVADGYPKRPAM